ncbi:hypothetical protein SOVF_069050, partial [Spinacia oleracea]
MASSSSPLNPPFLLTNSLSSPSKLFQFSPPSSQFIPQSRKYSKKRANLILCSSYEVGGGYPESKTTQEQFNEKPDSSQYEAILKGGEQVTSVLQEMITL